MRSSNGLRLQHPPGGRGRQNQAFDHHLHPWSGEFDAKDIPVGGALELCLGGLGWGIRAGSFKINFLVSSV